MKAPTLGLVLLAVGAAIEVVGAAAEIWQDQDVYTISSSITLPAFLGMIVGIPLISRGYGRVIRTVGGDAFTGLVTVGSVVGSALWIGAIWWQVTAGLPSGGNLDLDSYAAAALLFVGTALLARGTAEVAGSGRERSAWSLRTLVEGPGRERGRTALRPRSAAIAAGLAGVGGALLTVALVTVGWVNQHAVSTNSLYLLIGTETGGSGAWFLLVGYFGLLRSLPNAPQRVARVLGIGAGAALVLGEGLSWELSAPSVDASFVAALAVVIAGAGLVLLSARPTDVGQEPSR